MFSGLVRILSCLVLFGIGAEALGGGDIGLIGSAIVALAINHYWKAQQHADARQQHREDVIADEQLRLEVRERQAKP
jgi:hypothetical protein